MNEQQILQLAALAAYQNAPDRQAETDKWYAGAYNVIGFIISCAGNPYTGIVVGHWDDVAWCMESAMSSEMAQECAAQYLADHQQKV